MQKYLQKEILRQLIHASGVFIVVLNYFIPSVELIVLCMGILMVVLAIFRIDQHREIFFFSRLLKNCKREHERGFIYFFIGIILTLFFFGFNPAVANAAILLLVFGDSVSTLVGRKWGRIKLPRQERKTLEGSTAFLLVGFLVTLTQLPPLPALLGAIAGSLTEAYSPLDDNLTIPLVAGLVMILALYLPL